MSARWQDRAACRGEDPELFFQEDCVELAKAICARCPVIVQCRDFGRRSTAGVWGGESKDQKGAGPSLTNEYFSTPENDARRAKYAAGKGRTAVSV